MFFYTSIFISRRDMQGPITFNHKLPFQKFCLSRPRFFFQKLTKIVQKKIAGLHPALLPYEAVPHPPTQVGGDCLAAVVLDNQDRALRLYMRGR